jgi:hypothetical protein
LISDCFRSERDRSSLRHCQISIRGQEPAKTVKQGKIQKNQISQQLARPAEWDWPLWCAIAGIGKAPRQPQCQLAHPSF